ncbi:MAG: 2-oxoacid:ferredoxin oxidoreductase subunit beta [Proteobacteria bacterium]|nr:2-oxoacid:ferredoxin oxidoreductase subunit beta [Pseudomonadota bacterium]
MVNISDYGNHETAWCPGCGNFPILECVKRALVELELAPHRVLFVSGIGQAAKAPHYLDCNLFDGLHGRALPAATGAKLANRRLAVIVESGDGCAYGEGGNHFLAAIRRNVDLTLIVHNNQVYGLTKGQASPTSEEGFVTKAQPAGVFSEPFHPLGVAIAMHAGFVARSFSGMKEHVVEMIKRAVSHRGFSLVDVLQPCVSFNKVNTFAWYKDRCRPLPEGYDPTNWDEAMRTAMRWGEEIPIGVIYENRRRTFEEHFDWIDDGGLVDTPYSSERLAELIKGYA